MSDELKTIDKTQKTDSVKSHDEILELFEEIEQIEQELKNPDFSNKEKDNNISDDSSVIPELDKEQLSDFKKDVSFKKKRSLKKFFKRGKKKTKKIKTKKNLKQHKLLKLKFLKKKIFKKNKKPRASKKKSLDATKSTFTLKLDKSGNLLGLEIPKSKKPKQKFSLKTVFQKKHKKSDDTSSKSSDVKGLKALPVKLKGLLSHIPIISKKISTKNKSTEDNTSSKLSAILKKIKGIFSRK
jgi:hypothetical protein